MGLANVSKGEMMKNTLGLAIVCMCLAMISAVTAFAAPKTNQIRIQYVPPKEQNHMPTYEFLQERRVLERLQEFLSPFLLPRTLDIKVAGCDGEADAFYGDDEITICYEYVDDLFGKMPDKTTPSGIAPYDTVAGPFFETCLHEFAHALFDMFSLPILGRQEDAADQVAAYIYLQLGPVESLRLIKGTAYAFKAEADSKGMPVLSDDHGTPRQRAYNVLCIAYGADEEVFSEIVSGGYLPMKRAENCAEEYEQVQDAFEELISPQIDRDLAKKVLNDFWLSGSDTEVPRQ